MCICCVYSIYTMYREVGGWEVLLIPASTHTMTFIFTHLCINLHIDVYQLHIDLYLYTLTCISYHTPGSGSHACQVHYTNRGGYRDRQPLSFPTRNSRSILVWVCLCAFVCVCVCVVGCVCCKYVMGGPSMTIDFHPVVSCKTDAKLHIYIQYTHNMYTHNTHTHTQFTHTMYTHTLDTQEGGSWGSHQPFFPPCSRFPAMSTCNNPWWCGHHTHCAGCRGPSHSMPMSVPL